MKRKYETRLTSHEPRATSDECVGSALILAVVLTSLLAIIGTVFLMVARVDKIATSAITENKELQFALESLVAEISQQLALDVPHSDPNRLPQEYYDYPDPCNAFLASLEPYQSGSYYWRQISDVTGYIISPNDVPARIVGEHKRIDTTSIMLADADGDGVSDSIWIKLNDNTSKGKPVFAAIRVIDNGGMLNVNTAYKFDPTETIGRIDGSSQMQINLAALSQRGANGTLNVAANNLQAVRCGSIPPDIFAYEQNVIWRYGKLLGAYTPFDISDELTLKNRFLVKQVDTTTRIKKLWTKAYRWGLYAPRTKPPHSDSDPNDWFWYANNSSLDPDKYDYRHISTTYNMDRIITPDGEDPCIPNSGRMLNVNRIETSDLNRLYYTLIRGISPSVPDVNAVAAQLAVNIKDFSDSDTIVSTLPDSNGLMHYGFEAQPFISEIGIKIDPIAPNDVSKNHFAVELYNPFDVNIPLGDFILSLSNGPNIPLSGIIGPNDFFVVVDDFNAFSLPGGVNWQEDVALKLSGDYNDLDTDGIFESWDNYDIALKRDVLGTEIYLDNQSTEHHWFDPNVGGKYVQRDDTNWHIVYEDVNDSDFNPDTLGFTNNYRTTATNYNLALANHDFNTIGDIVLPLKIGPNTTPNGTIGQKLSSLPTEAEIRIDLTLPAYQHIFNYLTVFDPAFYPWNDPNETRIKGRININTAPWFVIAQLPWIQYYAPTDPCYIPSDPCDRAKAIVDYRDNILHGFRSIGELMLIPQMLSLCLDGVDNLHSEPIIGPDLTDDSALDDFEERDLIFSRISNLVTVRSDVFTAYILVRIGVDGPQKRAIAILDRSKVNDISGKVEVIALHPVPDPR